MATMFLSPCVRISSLVVLALLALPMAIAADSVTASTISGIHFRQNTGQRRSYVEPLNPLVIVYRPNLRLPEPA